MTRPRYRHNKKKNNTASPITVIAGAAIILAILWLANGNGTSTAGNSSATASTTAIDPSADLERVINPDGLDEWLIRYQAMTVSFNRETHQPNWVAWELLRSETDGESTRSDAAGFSPDPNVPGCARTTDYTHSGYDRGHMAPAADMKWSAPAMNQSFLMTNICPQAGELNRGTWSKLEEKCRQKAMADSAIVIVCGPIFTKGKALRRIGDTGVAVPDSFFKVILSPYADPPTAIGFIMPNGEVPGGMQTHAVPVDKVEEVTGYDFFSALPDELEDKLESTCDFSRWSRIRRK